MSRSYRLQVLVHLSLATAILGTALPAAAQQSPPRNTEVLGAVIVTAQKREESIQDVPIAVSAFSADELTARGLDGGPNILQAIPNVSFSKANFTSFNLQIRGVGTKLIGGSGDQGVGIHLNNAPLLISRFFEAEFYDIDRIEVLRGPQGTVYGRNATGGVFNAISAKPTDKLEGSLTLDGGNYDSRKIKGMVNIPLGEMFQLRIAGSFLERDGYVHDTVHDTNVDGRDIVSNRVTLAFKPAEMISGYLLWEHFEENDDRQRIGPQLCTSDPGPATVGGVSTTAAPASGLQPRAFLSQGCLPGSIYASAALSPINTNGALGGEFANFLGIGGGANLYAGQTLSPNLRTTGSYYLPKYYAKSDLAELNIEIKPSDRLTLTSLTSFNQDRLNSREDYYRTVPGGKFLTTAPLSPLLLQGGNFVDPQIGSANTLAVYDQSFADNTTWTEELRLQSSFDGPINFNVGGIYIDLNNPITGYYVFFNTGTAYAQCFNAGFCNTNAITGASLGVPAVPMYIDPNTTPNGEGHNYYFNRQATSLKSVAGFGELYWQMRDTFKWTLGVRYTSDKKTSTNYDFNQQFIYPGQGFGPGAITFQETEFKATTGRFGFDWKVGENSLLYAFYSKGYKGGGFNPATAGNVKTTFDPEFVNAIELGTKNTFADGRLQANATVFSYDYKGYQISRIVNLTAVNDNIDAKIHGVEFELAWQPLTNTRFDANVGYLKTEIQDGSAVDVMNRTQGDPTLTVVKGLGGTNCVAPTAAVATVIGAINAGLAPTTTLPSICPSANFPFGRFSASETRPGANYLGFTIEPGGGVSVPLAGKELPNSPHWTFNVGAQQSFKIDGNWRGTLRGDYYRQTDSFARFYNSEFDRLRGWSNVNLSLSIDNPISGWSWLLYVKNLIGDDNITDTYLTDDSSGLYANTFLTDPRLYGLSVTKKF